MNDRNVVTTQATAKRHKAHMLAGGTLAAIGLGGSLGLIFAGEAPGVALPVIGLAGLAYYLFARARAWWHHG